MIEYIILGGIIILAVTAVAAGVSINKAAFNKYDSIVKQSSRLYKNLSELNSSYKFNSGVYPKYNYYIHLQSKKGLENLDLYDCLKNILAEKEEKFENIFVKLKANSERWEKYEKEYSQIQTVRSWEIEKRRLCLILRIQLHIYNRHEMRLLWEYKLNRPITETSVFCHASCTNPAGKSNWKGRLYTHEQVYDCLLTVKENRETEHRLEEEKAAHERALIAKERELTEKEKDIKAKEKKLQDVEQREKELAAKEQQLAKAAQERSYSAKRTNTNDDENLSPYEQLKKLEQLLDKGEITYDEYARRKSLIFFN